MKKLIFVIAVTVATLNCIAQAVSLDLSFSFDGKVSTDIGGYADVGKSVAIQSDGKIVVAGYSEESSNPPFYSVFSLVRYNSDGTLDNTFDSDGKVTTNLGSHYDEGYSLIIQSDGKIVVAGAYFDSIVGPEFAIVRYNSNGTLDNTFGSSGKVTTDVISGNVTEGGSSVAIQSDGKILVAGMAANNGTNCDFALVRYNTNGTLDNTFDSDGKVIATIGNPYSVGGLSVSVQSDGKIVMAGSSYNGSDYDFALFRYNSNGTLDNTFDSDGKVTTDFGNSNDYGYSVRQQTDGKIVVVGSSDVGSNEDFALARYNSNGTLDNTFDSDGKLITNFGSSYADRAYSVTIQSDGKILVTGVSSHGSASSYFALARYNSNGTLDNTFDSDGIVTPNVGGGDYNYIKNSSAIQSDGKIVMAGSIFNNYYDFFVARFDVGTTGISTIAEQNMNVEIYPNPTTGTFNLSYQTIGTEDLQIRVLNILGEVVYSMEYKKVSSKFLKELNLTNVASGIYSVQIKTGKKVYQQKLVKE